jgi:addiction module RelE/StbE family toxin
MRLVWSRFALADRDAIFDYVQVDSPRAAVALDDLISLHVGRLAQFPESGRIGHVDGTRELIIDQTPYLAAYRITGDAVLVLRILHGAQRWPDDMPE